MTIREELEKLTLEARTPEAQTNEIIEILREVASIGEGSARVVLPEDTEYKITANLKNKYVDLNVECINEEEGLYEISWMKDKEVKPLF